MSIEQNITNAPFKFKNFIIAESHIKIDPETKAESINIKIEPKGIIFEEKKIFEVHLAIFLSSNDNLDVFVKMIGLFEFKDVIVQENLKNYFYVNAPAIIFPYLRSYISALTALSGCNTIILPPMNMTSLGKDLEKNTIKK
jgi:preprotein translocase subunit SecB